LPLATAKLRAILLRVNARGWTGLLFWLAGGALAEPPPVSIAEFAHVAAGQYQVLAQSGAGRAWEVNRFMNRMLREYSRFFSNWQPKPGARVVVFDNMEDFRAYSAQATRATHEQLAGYCHLKTDEEGNTFYELVTYEHENLWPVLAHEGFHQFLGYELGLEVPMWLNEGLAQYFETSRVVAGRFLTGEVSARKLRAARYALRTGQAPRISQLLTMDRASFYSQAQTTYPASWALVHYLLHRDGSSYRSSEFRRYLAELKRNADSIRSFQRRFGAASAEWQRDFERYVFSLQPQVE
jgi:hypothetical protein